MLNSQVLHYAQLQAAQEGKLADARKKRRKAIDEVTRLQKDNLSLKSLLRLANSKLVKETSKTKAIADVLKANTAALLEAKDMSTSCKKREAELSKKVDILKQEAAEKIYSIKKEKANRTRALSKEISSAAKQLKATREREKRCRSKIADDGERAKRVFLTELKNKAEAKERMEKFTNNLAEHIRRKAEKQKVDNITRFTLGFADMPDMEMVVAEEADDDSDDEDEDAAGNTVEISDEDVKEKIRRAIAIADKKYTSTASLKAQAASKSCLAPKDLKKYVEELAAVNDEVAELVGLRYEEKRAEVNIKKFLKEVIELR